MMVGYTVTWGFDHKKRLLVGRAKEIVVTATGENIYLDDVENTMAIFDT